MRKQLSIIALIFPMIACAAEPLLLGSGSEQYVVRQIGTTTYIEPSPPVGVNGVVGAVVGTGIAANLQSKPIKLQKNTDFACKYKDIISTKLENCDY